jgi:23S rRNA C2498 (ribose-2'-O)-methylase RlmM
MNMSDDLETLVAMHDLAAECRRLAIDVADREISRKLFRLSDELEQYLREATFGHKKKFGRLANDA